MDRDTIIRLAQEADPGFETDTFHAESLVGIDAIERFAALVKQRVQIEQMPKFEELAKMVREDEREACAKVCEDMWHEWLDSPEENEPNKPDAEDCYRAIRRRA